MHEGGSRPRARQDGLLEERVGEELLLYDQETHTAHCLSPIAASVWRHCDGEHDLAELAVIAGVSEDLIASALYELRQKELLDTEPALTQSTIPGESRREAIVRTARYGAAAAAGSMIVSATAATPAMASSIVWEITEVEETKTSLKCSGTSTFVCCICTKGYAQSVGGTEAECKNIVCIGKRGVFKEFKEDMQT
jgi:hypothetical protein